jgi:hypothetical protein
MLNLHNKSCLKNEEILNILYMLVPKNKGINDKILQNNANTASKGEYINENAQLQNMYSCKETSIAAFV